MKKIFAVIIALIPVLFAGGCSDPTEVYDTIPTSLCIVNSGLQNADASGGLTTFTYKISVYKGGYNDVAAVAALSVDAAALSEYNEKKGTAYALLPEAYYTMTATQFNLDTGSPYGISPVVFDVAKMKKDLDENTGYVLPVTLSSASEINADKKHVLIKVEFN